MLLASSEGEQKESRTTIPCPDRKLDLVFAVDRQRSHTYAKGEKVEDKVVISAVIFQWTYSRTSQNHSTLDGFALFL